jgi:hypothetical protein
MNMLKWTGKIGDVNQISIVYKTICSLIKCQLDRERKLILSIYIEDKKLLSLGKSSVRRLLTIWTNISICSNDKDVIDDDEGSRTRFVDLSSSDDDDLIKVFDEGTDGVKFS